MKFIRRLLMGILGGALVFGAVPIFTSLFSRVLGRKLSVLECVGLAVGLAEIVELREQGRGAHPLARSARSGGRAGA